MLSQTVTASHGTKEAVQTYIEYMENSGKVLAVSSWGIERKIFVIRGHRVLLDHDLAALYSVPVKRLNEQVRRNKKRFPKDFMFQLSGKEHGLILRSQIATLRLGHGRHRKYRPCAFTEQGVAMLSGVLNSEKSIAVNVEIMRAFVRLRRMVTENESLCRRLDELERRYDGQFKAVFDAIRGLMHEAEKPRKRIGFL